MQSRPAAWLSLLWLGLATAWAQAPLEDPVTPAPPAAPDDGSTPGEAPGTVKQPDRFLPSDKISPDSVISFPADI
jgi:hypothetical protein